MKGRPVFLSSSCLQTADEIQQDFMIERTTDGQSVALVAFLKDRTGGLQPVRDYELANAGAKGENKTLKSAVRVLPDALLLSMRRQK